MFCLNTDLSEFCRCVLGSCSGVRRYDRCWLINLSKTASYQRLNKIHRKKVGNNGRKRFIPFVVNSFQNNRKKTPQRNLSYNKGTKILIMGLMMALQCSVLNDESFFCSIRLMECLIRYLLPKTRCFE